MSIGVPDRNRTCNPQLRRLVLYPVELRAQFFRHPTNFVLLEPGRGGEIRTPDILLPKQARYQATLHPEGAPLYRPSTKMQFIGLSSCGAAASQASGNTPWPTALGLRPGRSADCPTTGWRPQGWVPDTAGTGWPASGT